jgi:hypothetical protein
LTWSFIKTDDWTEKIIRLFVQIKNIFHVPNVVAGNFSYAPAFD